MVSDGPGFRSFTSAIIALYASRVPRIADHTPRTQSVLIAHSGGLGDLVLASQAIDSIKCAHPEWNVTLACTAELMEIANLFPVPPDEVIPIGCNPYRWPNPCPELIEELRPFIELLKSRAVDIYVSAELQPTWLGWLLASVLRPGVALCCTSVEAPERFVAGLRAAFGLEPWPLRQIAPLEEIHEQGRYELLLQALDVPARSFFPWDRPKRVREGDYLVCFPSGSPGTKIKRWPMENFAAALGDFQARWRLPVVLLGSAGEREELQDLAARIGGAEIFSGEPLAVAAAVMANARLYLGNDTGPMHLAAAYGVPGVAIYGGGTWPFYAPWGPGSIGLVKPIPCFGCNWDCVFGQGICVEGIPVDEVRRALDDAMNGCGRDHESRFLHGVDPKLEQIIRGAASRYRMLQGDRAARLAALESAVATVHEQQRRIESLEAAAEARLKEVETWRDYFYRRFRRM